jgi:hypothetical protein
MLNVPFSEKYHLMEIKKPAVRLAVFSSGWELFFIREG